MSRSASILFCVMLVASHASAEIFKCAGKDGLDLYQNFPCQFESMGWASMNMQSPKAPLASTDSSQPNTKIRAREAASVGKAGSPPREPRLGMTMAEVRALWGEPADTEQEEPGEGGRSELWSYGNTRSVRFDHKGRVSAIQQ